MPFGRARRSDVDITIRRSAAPSQDTTLPLGEDDTLPLDR
jgi:hypothetical protein